MNHHFQKYPMLCRYASLLLLTALLGATETENLGLSVLPAAGPVAIDGAIGDWDLSSGVFACNDCENQRDQYAVWLHAMADKDNLYILARWIDETPANNPGQTIADYGWNGDCLQIRMLLNRGTPQQQKTVINCWKGSDGADVLQFDVDGRNWGPAGKDQKSAGAKQAFRSTDDGKGYVQEIALPWRLLTPDGLPPKAAGGFVITFEPNFTVGGKGRLSIKDVFKPGVNIDRVFTFMADPCWGEATLVAAGTRAPHPVRLSDAREFPVHMVEGRPVIDWAGLIKTTERAGFAPIAFTMPEDGYVSLNLVDHDGVVARQLLTGTFYAKGEHTVLWDGLTTPNWRTPGEPVAPGTYRWEGIRHQGIHLALRGWAANAGSAPWDAGPTTNWGGDHGMPDACVATDDGVVLGWSGAEAGSAVVACDLQGQARWRNSRNGMAGAELIAAGSGGLYVMNWKGNLYRIATKDASYVTWEGTTSTDLFVKDLWGEEKGMPEEANAMTVAGDHLLLGFTKANLVAVLDARSGKLLKRLTVPAPTAIKSGSDGGVYVLSGGAAVLALDVGTGVTRPVVGGLANAVALAVDRAGDLYVGLGAPENQVRVFTPAGKNLRTIGRVGGRAAVGKWTPDGMAYIHDLTVDAAGQLWVAEMDMLPKRFSVWNATSGAFVRELFGPTTYGALGGAINPRDPLLMVGQGCEWRLDAATGRASCLGVITHEGMENARFGTGTNGRLYLAVAPKWWEGDVLIYERVGTADFRLRTRIKAPTKEVKGITVWADANGDGLEQPGESRTTELDLNGWITGWSMPMAPDLSFYGSAYRVRVTGYTACGAPEYDLTKAEKLPAPEDLGNRGGMGAQRGLGNPVAGKVLYNGVYNQVNSNVDCFDIASGKRVWSYPSNFTGVHGSHMAGAAAPGLIRGAFDICGTFNLPKPIGAVWAITTNFGEWHLLTEKGFYLGRLFEPDAMRTVWPEKAVPGVSLDRVPSGMGGEDFGGSLTQTTDGRIFVQAGKTGFWNVEVTGLETTRALPGGEVRITPADIAKAQTCREGYLQSIRGTSRTTVPHLKPAFTGKLEADFTGAPLLSYRKQDEAAVRSSCTWDDTTLYLAWEVRDNTPWVNGASDATQLYLGGDTVDFQLGTDPAAAPARGESAAGDLRLSIGNFQGTPTAMLYRKVSAVKKPRTFSSGIIKSYPMDFVDRIDARIAVAVDPGKGYVVEAAVPLAELGLAPGAKTLRGDFGVTHGGASGDRTRLRTYWANQHTGIVDDSVYELMLEPTYWGELQFAP